LKRANVALLASNTTGNVGRHNWPWAAQSSPWLLIETMLKDAVCFLFFVLLIQLAPS